MSSPIVDAKSETTASLLVIRPPTISQPLSLIGYALPLRFFAIHTELTRGTDIDSPRHLVKLMTVD